MSWRQKFTEFWNTPPNYSAVRAPTRDRWERPRPRTEQMRYCGGCGEQYRDDYDACPDCQAARDKHLRQIADNTGTVSTIMVVVMLLLLLTSCDAFLS